MEIKRDLYLDKLKSRMHNKLIKVITGLRRSGKSYLLFKIFRDYLAEIGIDNSHVIEIEFDRLKNIGLRNIVSACEYVKSLVKDDGMYYVLLDEIQFVPNFEELLNEFLHVENMDVYVTGSNSKFLSSDIVTEFRGRGDEVHVFPLSFREFSSVCDGSDAYDDFALYGGLPLVLQKEREEDKVVYLKSEFNKTYLSDIVERNGIRNEDELGELIDILASGVGSLTNPLKLSNSFMSIKNKKISAQTIKRYIRHLEDAYIVSHAMRYDIKGKRYINSPMKYYFEDLGLRNARLGFRQTEHTHIMENIIFNELRIRGYNVDVGVVELRSSGKNGENCDKKQVEVDFVANLGNRRYYIQSCLHMDEESVMKREKRPFENIRDSFKKIVVVKDDTKTTHDENGIVTMSIKNFLLNPNSLEM